MKLFTTANMYMLFEVTALVIAIIYSKRILRSNIKALPLYLLVIVLFDVVAYYRRSQGLGNAWINDVVIPFEFCYLILMYRSFVSRTWMKNAAFLLVGLYLLFFVLDEFVYKAGYTRLYLRSYVTGVITLMVMVLLYGYELLNSEKLFKYYKQPEFWLSVGILLFYLGTLPFHLAWNITAIKFVKTYNSMKFIFYSMLCTIYFFFAISMLCLKPTAK